MKPTLAFGDLAKQHQQRIVDVLNVGVAVLALKLKGIPLSTRFGSICQNHSNRKIHWLEAKPLDKIHASCFIQVLPTIYVVRDVPCTSALLPFAFEGPLVAVLCHHWLPRAASGTVLVHAFDAACKNKRIEAL